MARLPRYEFNREYVERLLADDPETQRHFTGYFKDLLSLKLRSRLRSKGAVDDAIQETFARVLAALKNGKLAVPEALGAFVNSVGSNVLYEMCRSGARTTPLEDGYDRSDDRIFSAESTLVAAESNARVREVLAGLPNKERQLLRWLFFEGRDKDDVCRELSVDRDYLRVLLHRAKMRFKDRYLTD